MSDARLRTLVIMSHVPLQGWALGRHLAFRQERQMFMFQGDGYAGDSERLWMDVENTLLTADRQAESVGRWVVCIPGSVGWSDLVEATKHMYKDRVTFVTCQCQISQKMEAMGDAVHEGAEVIHIPCGPDHERVLAKIPANFIRWGVVSVDNPVVPKK